MNKRKLKDIGISEVVAIKNKIRNKEETTEELLELKQSVIDHLNTPSGTIGNYHGKWGCSIIDIAIECYPEMFDADEFERIIRRKISKAFDVFYTSVIDGVKAPNGSDGVRFIKAYLMDKDEQNNSSVTVLDNRTYYSTDGVYTEREPKE